MMTLVVTRFSLCLILVTSWSAILAAPSSWFYKAPKTFFGLAGSASATASAQSTGGSVIADLRKTEAKAAQLQEDKHPVGLEPLEDNTNPSDDDESNNEASPSLLQKKFGKILTKLRIIAQIKNAYNYRPEVTQEPENFTFTVTSNKAATEQLEKLQVDPKSEYIQHIPNAHKPVATEGPVKVQLELTQNVNDKLDALEEPAKNEKIKEHEPGKLGALGVFFAEIIGSVVALTYGAVAQLTSGGQNPVTVSTSEGL